MKMAEPRKPRSKKAKAAVAAAIAVLAAAAAVAAAFALKADGGGEPARGGSGDLVIPLGDISATAAFYPVETGGTKLEVIAVEAPDGTVRTAFNTCQVCYGSGRGYYKQSGDVLVCQNCGNSFPMSRVEVETGGCNPWPIFPEDKTVTDESITISGEFLEASKGIFARWKAS